jgi:Family of unknown function (DUF6600)/FecR protein
MKRASTRLCLIAFCVLALVSVSALWADPPTRVGRLNYMSGTVSYHPESVEDWAVATVNYPMTIGDNLWTDKDGEAEVHVGTTAIRLASNTEISFLNLDDQAIQIRLSTGSLNIRLRSLGPNEEIEIDTPNASLSLLRAGSYRMDVQQNGDTTVTARSGEVEVTAGTSIFPVRQQQAAAITGTDSPTYQIANAPFLDAWDQWCQARDQKEDHIASAQYVPANEVDGVEDLDQYGSWSVDPSLGPVWTPLVTVAGWAPYRFGHWAWVDPWGWTWIDDAPWGFAPFHYGRWTYRNNAWAWIPGAHIGHPVYAPALVTFIGGSGWRPDQAPGESVGWFPLGPHEPYVAPYRSDKTRQHNIDVEHFSYANRNIPGAVTVVPSETFIRGQPTSQAALRLQGNGLAQAPVRGAVAPLVPQKESVLGGYGVARGNSVARPPASVVSRPVVARLTPAPQAAPFASRQQAFAAHPGQPIVVGTTASARQPTPAARPQVKVVTPAYERASSGQPAPVPKGQVGGGQPSRPSSGSQGGSVARPPQSAARPPVQGVTARQPVVRQPAAPAQSVRTSPQTVPQPQGNRPPQVSNPPRQAPGASQSQSPLIKKENRQ